MKGMAVFQPSFFYKNRLGPASAGRPWFADPNLDSLPQVGSQWSLKPDHVTSLSESAGLLLSQGPVIACPRAFACARIHLPSAHSCTPSGMLKCHLSDTSPDTLLKPYLSPTCPFFPSVCSTHPFLEYYRICFLTLLAVHLFQTCMPGL